MHIDYHLHGKPEGVKHPFRTPNREWNPPTAPHPLIQKCIQKATEKMLEINAGNQTIQTNTSIRNC